jgi:hypothetical protein
MEQNEMHKLNYYYLASVLIKMDFSKGKGTYGRE